MKRLTALLLVCILSLFVFAGCTSTASNTETTSTEATEQENTKTKGKYKDSLEGVAGFMEEKGYIKTDGAQKMQGKYIGAQEGYSYTFDNTVVEIYRFNLNKLNDTAKEYIDTAGTNGSITLYGTLNVEAHLALEGKYMMVFKHVSGDDELNQKLDEAGKYFETFYPEE